MTQRFIVLFCFVLVGQYVNGYLIKGRSFEELATKEIPMEVELENKLSNPEPASEVPVPQIFIDKKCAAVGQFCNNHSDCCSNSCLGYLKRCVS